MTPAEWYAKKRAEYRAATGREWRHRTDQGDAIRDADASEVSEIAMRSGIECRWLQASGWDETMMVANAVLIRDTLNGDRRDRDALNQETPT